MKHVPLPWGLLGSLRLRTKVKTRPTCRRQVLSSYPGGHAASWCIQRTRMVIHRHALLLQLIPADDKVYIHTAPPAPLCAALRRPRSPSSFFSPLLFLLKLPGSFPPRPSLRLRPNPPCLARSGCVQRLSRPDAASPPHYVHSPSALCFLSLTHPLGGSPPHTRRCVPPPCPPRLLALSSLSSISLLSLPLSLSL